MMTTLGGGGGGEGDLCLTEHPFNVLMDTFAKCPVPLFLKVTV